MSVKISRRKFLGVSLGLLGTGIFYGGIRLDSIASNNTSGTRLLSNNIPSNLYWPSGQFMPTFNSPVTLDVATLIGIPEDQQVMFSTLQGLVNRIQPQIYLLQDDEEGRLTWLQELNIPYRFLSSPWDLFSLHKDVLRGIIVYDDNMLDTINVATTFSSIYSSIVVSPKLVSEVESYTSLPIRLTLIDKYNSPYQAYSESYLEWNRLTTKRIIVGIAPEVAKAQPAINQIPYFGEIGMSESDIQGPISYVPNPFFRDYSVAVNAFCFWLDPLHIDQSDLFSSILSQQNPDSMYLGWFKNANDGGENAGVSICSNSQLRTGAADFCTNLTVFSGVRSTITPQKMPAIPALSNSKYVTITFTEGDNLEYCQHRLRVVWDDINRGAVPLNFTIDPLLKDAAPSILNYYLTTATGNDCLVAGPSGAGYIFPSKWPVGQIDGYLENSQPYLSAVGLNVINILDHPGGSYVGTSQIIGSSYETYLNPIGILADWQGQNSVSILGSNLPAITGQLASNAVELQLILEAIAADTATLPGFYSIGAVAWNLTPTDILNTLNTVGISKFNLVRGDTFFGLLRQHLGLSQWT